MREQIHKSMIARAKSGDDAALTAIYDAYKQKVQRYLYYRIGNLHTAEDLTTEVFLRVIENLPAYRFQEAPFQAWVFQIARNLAVDHFRRQQHRNHLPLDTTLPANGDGPDALAARSVTSEQLSSALHQLTDGQRDVIVLRFIAEMTIADVAQALGKSESAVKGLQARGLEALNRVLSKRKVTHEAIG
ncbi:MAG TPA: sigma-70 family RNA polymerase sigma factor [Candidatus Sulfomarinibacteraceae bacterium]|nr:sigma-70 family RNA polymerase sigma factor [Candidatus Sulfomarinibacteraceae bacterium]